MSKELVCDNCGKVFSRDCLDSDCAKVFCTRSCAAIYHNARRKLTGSCKNCGKDILKSKRYCSKECKELLFLKRKESSKEKRIRKRKSTNKMGVVNFRRRQKIKGVKYKGGKCIFCGYNRCVYSLHFHHVDPVEKIFGIGSMVRKWETIRKELDKCILVCSNCHGEIHDGFVTMEDILKKLKEMNINIYK